MGMEAAAIGIGGTMLAGGMLSGYYSGKANVASAQANAQSAAIGAAAEAQQMRLTGASQAANAMIEAANFDAQADYYLRQAGNFQLQGRQERENVGLELLDAKGTIVSSAAGSGISADSRVVNKTMDDAVKRAYANLEVSARNEYEQVYGAMKAKKTAEVNAANARSIGAWASSAYNSLAGDVERYGALTANSILDAGYDSAVGSLVGGVFGGIGSGVSTGLGIAAL